MIENIQRYFERRFPQILAALAENRISLTVAGLLAPVLDDGNVEKLLSDCEGMSSREVEEYIVALRPKPVFEPSIRRAPSPPAAPLTLQARIPAPASPTRRPIPQVSPTKRDVKRKLARRLTRKTKSDDRSRSKTRVREFSAKNRYVSSQVRERIHARANDQCEYTSSDGTRCRSRTGLQIEHELPFAIHSQP